ncbi:hypothetical protein F4677DRAFT_439894 [Hypoxylon crocopeplum]|nr:hypothetical protein F4677DRAFT_439894 [Hypoxylon crocopeplum]
MRAVTLFGLLAGSATSKALKYAIPLSLKATDCTLPANYTVTNFTIYTNSVDSSKNTTSFGFVDEDTGIDTFCVRNSTSKPSTVASNRWPCDDPLVAFIWQTTGIAGLTMIETACPQSDLGWEASGLITPKLACTNSTSGSTCVATQSILGDFDSLEPAPRPPPSR